jgi:regulator of replication initiation timing
MLTDNTELRLEIEKIKKKLDNQDKNMEIVFRYLDELIEKKENPKPRTKIGINKAVYGLFDLPHFNPVKGSETNGSMFA